MIRRQLEQGGDLEPSRWQQAQRLFHEALDQPRERREAFVRDRCGSDHQLAEQVLELLSADSQTEPLIPEEALNRIAAQLIDSEAPPIDRIGPYSLGPEIGRGGMGVVYHAEREDLDTHYALKILTDAGLSPERYRRFLNEQRILARLQHPGIARFFDAGTLDAGTPYIVMELVAGEPITSFCETREFPLGVRLALFRSTCEAVAFAHRQAIVHRDIKPSNVLAVEGGAGEGQSIKLLDFGIAKTLGGEDDAEQRATRTQLQMMTPAYAAPEQVQGKTVGVYTDVYALGVLLYELLAGDRPFDLSTTTPARVEQVVCHETPEPPSRRRARGSHHGISATRAEWADLDTLCAKAMHKDPNRRYSSVEALIADLDRFTSGRPLHARPDSMLYRAGKFVRRNRRDVTVAAAVMFAIVGLTGFYTHQLTQARDAAVSEAQRTERVKDFMLSLFGDRAAGPPRDMTVRDLLSRGEREADLLDRDPETQAALLATLAQMHSQLGNFAEAEDLVARSLELRKRAFGPRAPSVAESLMIRALLRAEQSDQLDAAEADARRALSVVAEHRSRHDPDLARALMTVGVVQTERGDYQAAIASLSRALSIQERQGQSGLLAEVMGHLATAHAFAEQYETADRLYQQLLELEASVFGRRHPQYAGTLLNLGSIHTERGFHEEAEQFARQALEIHRDYYGDEHLSTASNLSILGEILVQKGELEQAAATLDEALRIRQALLGREHRLVGVTLGHVAQIAKLRDELTRARRLYTRQLAIFEKVFPGGHRWTAAAWSNLATIDYKQDNLAACAESLGKAAAMYERALSPSSVQVGIARIKLGQVLVDLGRLEDARRELTRGGEIIDGQLAESSMWFEQLEKGFAALRRAGERAATSN